VDHDDDDDHVHVDDDGHRADDHGAVDHDHGAEDHDHDRSVDDAVPISVVCDNAADDQHDPRRGRAGSADVHRLMGWVLMFVFGIGLAVWFAVAEIRYQSKNKWDR
jgi:hypothetical protein